MTPTPRRAIAWFRRDLRLGDNRMLEAATSSAERVWPVFVADPDLLADNASAPGRVAWFDASVRALDHRLQEAGSGLTVLRGRPEVVLRDFAAAVEADAIYASSDEEPIAVARDARVAEAVELRLVDDQRILPPGEVRTAEGEPYRVYSPFRRALDTRVEEAPDALLARADARLERLAGPPEEPPGLDVPPAPHELPPAGEEAAIQRLRAFLRQAVDGYRDDRDRPDLDATSRISPYLRVGAISIRACWRAARNAAERGRETNDAELLRGATSWRGELAWREFFAHLLAAHPDVVDGSLRPEFQHLAWVDGSQRDELLAAWRIGRTGYPFVDAGMRQLRATGWMHNRARLVAASLLVKDLGIDWRTGESVFMEHLLDGDTAQNNGNWQWVAGVGTDAAPYFRVFNPTLQAKRFDPDGAYVRQWVPELAHLSASEIHEPWRSARPPDDYPAPIVDHAEARRRTLARYQDGAATGRSG